MRQIQKITVVVRGVSAIVALGLVVATALLVTAAPGRKSPYPDWCAKERGLPPPRPVKDASSVWRTRLGAEIVPPRHTPPDVAGTVCTADPNSSVAFINVAGGQSRVHEGDRVDGMRVKRIEPGTVVFDNAGVEVPIRARPK